MRKLHRLTNRTQVASRPRVEIPFVAHSRYISSQVIARPSMGPACALSTQSSSSQFSSDELPAGEIRFGTAIAQGPREDLEDAICVASPGIDGHLFAAVFDGHGGSRASAYLEEHMFEFLRSGQSPDACALALARSPINVIKNILKPKPAGEESDPNVEVFRQALASGTDAELTAALQERFKTLDERVIKFLNSCALQSERESGSTATVLLLSQDRLAVANVGDSRAVLSRGGEPVVLSSEHRVYGGGEIVETEIKRIEAGGGWVDDGRVLGVLGVSRAFGDIEFKGPGLEGFLRSSVEAKLLEKAFVETVQFKYDPVTALPDVTIQPLLASDEFVIVASDGLWDVIGNKQAVQFVRKALGQGQNLDDIAAGLVDRAIQRGTGDNVSVVIVELGRTIPKTRPVAFQAFDNLTSKGADFFKFGFKK